MSERGMGSAVGQVPEYIEMVARWCKAHTRMPVIVKLTPNITNIRGPARAARKGGADAVSLINTINSITGVDLDIFAPEPTIDGKGSHGGYCGPAVKPIALNMVAEIARDPETQGLPISGIGGIATWKDAAEFLALGAENVQVCTAAMAYGFKIVAEMISGLERFLDERGFAKASDIVGRAVPNVTDWQYLNLNYVTKARIDQDLCIKCGRCFAACEDTSHQAIAMISANGARIGGAGGHGVSAGGNGARAGNGGGASGGANGGRRFEVVDEECVACNLCIEVCPVENCITMVQLTEGTDPRTGKPIDPTYANWTTHPNNPNAKVG
jgi:dihydropyrimidine dehydrogenase (NAD+) subunit PreA